jgi:hypothetical protein
MEIINLTGHDVIVQSKNGDITIPSSGMLRANYTTNSLYELPTIYGRIPITQNIYHRIRKMPEQKPNTYYLVSRIVAEIYPERDDLLITNGLIKEKGIAIACRSLGKI